MSKRIKNIPTQILTKAVSLLAVLCLTPLLAAAQTTTPKPCFDFSGSGRTSFATFSRDNPNYIFRILGNPTSANFAQVFYFGLSTLDNPTPGYFDADNRADVAVFRPSAATFFVRPTATTALFQAQQFGLPTDLTGRDADYDGDGRDDITVVREVGNNLVWFILRSSTNTFNAVTFGTSGFSRGTGDLPIAGADYNNDGRADITVIRRGTDGAATYIAGDSTTGAIVTSQPWGNFDTDFFVIGDYLGDRRADFAVYRAFQGGVNGTWFILENGGTNIVVRPFGLTSLTSAADRPICGDYNGDGKSDIAIYRSTNSGFYWLNSPDFNTSNGQQFGQPGDFPVAGLRAF